jgi:hypothetical protein
MFRTHNSIRRSSRPLKESRDRNGPLYWTTHSSLSTETPAGDDFDLFPDDLKPYLAYVRDPAHRYVSVTIPIGDSMELSVRT